MKKVKEERKTKRGEHKGVRKKKTKEKGEKITLASRVRTFSACPVGHLGLHFNLSEETEFVPLFVVLFFTFFSNLGSFLCFYLSRLSSLSFVRIWATCPRDKAHVYPRVCVHVCTRVCARAWQPALSRARSLLVRPSISY